VTGGRRQRGAAVGEQAAPAPGDLDALDRRIIELLRQQGRATNQALAQKLGVAAATVSARIRRLARIRAMKVVAVTDFAALGYGVVLAIGVHVLGRAAEEVARDLAKLREVFAVHIMTGAWDIEILVALRDFDELHAQFLKNVARIRGIRSIDCSIATEIVKFDFDSAPIA